MNQQLISLLPLVLGVALDGAPVEQQVLACAAVMQEDARLRCFDSLAQQLAPESPPGATAWRSELAVNPLDDTTTVVLSAAAHKVLGGGDPARQPRLVLRCRSGQPEVFVNWQGFISLDVLGDGHTVTYRLGKLAAVEETWRVSTAFDATFLPSESSSQFVLEALVADSIVVQTAPYGENPATAVFSTEGLGVEFPAFDEACDLPEWPVPPGHSLGRDAGSGQLRVLAPSEISILTEALRQLDSGAASPEDIALAVASNAIADKQVHPITARELGVLQEARRRLREMEAKPPSSRARFLNQRLNRFDLAVRRPADLAAIEAGLDSLRAHGTSSEVAQVAWLNTALRSAGFSGLAAVPDFLRDTFPEDAAP